MMLRTIAVAVAVLLTAAAAPAALAESTKERLDALERKLDSRSLLDMLNRVEQLQRDVQQLRGDLELQAHQLENLQRQQREQYLDTDRRLQQLESGIPGGMPGALPETTSGMIPPAMPGAAPELPPAAEPELPAAAMPGMMPETTAPPQVLPPGAATTAPPAVQPPPAPPPAAAVSPEAAKAEYDTALAILREGRYNEAAQAFNRFLTANPGSEFADNASYWLGETYYVTRDFDLALATFQSLVNNYPQSSKVSDSHLKMGYIQYEKKNWAAAREHLNLVVTRFPGTTTARLASDRLQRMRQEGH